MSDAVIIRFKRATLSRWAERNPILKSGEAGYVYDTGKLKVGDGKTAWNELPYVGDHSIQSYSKLSDLPEVGEAYKLYAVLEDHTIYEYSPTEKSYKQFVITGANVSQEYIDAKISEMFANSENKLQESLNNIDKSIQELNDKIVNIKIGNIHGGNA